MTSARATKLTFATLTTAILIAVMAALIFANPNSALAAGPDRPTDLVATAVDHDTVSLTWSHPDPTTVDHYQVLSRTVDSGTRLLQVGTSTTTSFEHDGLEPESTYVYRVKPVNSGGEEGRRSARAEATTPAEETPAPAPEPDPTPVPDPTPAPPQRSDDKGQDNIARSSHVVLVSSDWSLTPTGLTSGEQFRLIFLSSTKRDGSSTDIANYNTFVQTRLCRGRRHRHPSLQRRLQSRRLHGRRRRHRQYQHHRHRRAHLLAQRQQGRRRLRRFLRRDLGR